MEFAKVAESEEFEVYNANPVAFTSQNFGKALKEFSDREIVMVSMSEDKVSVRVRKGGATKGGEE